MTWQKGFNYEVFKFIKGLEKTQQQNKAGPSWQASYFD